MSEASGKGWRTAREEGDLLAGKAGRLHQEGCSDGGPRFPSQQASHGQRAAEQGEEVVESLEGGRQAEQMVRGQDDFGRHFSSRAGGNLKSGPLLVRGGH